MREVGSYVNSPCLFAAAFCRAKLCNRSERKYVFISEHFNHNACVGPHARKNNIWGAPQLDLNTCKMVFRIIHTAVSVAILDTSCWTVPAFQPRALQLIYLSVKAQQCCWAERPESPLKVFAFWLTESHLRFKVGQSSVVTRCCCRFSKLIRRVDALKFKVSVVNSSSEHYIQVLYPVQTAFCSGPLTFDAFIRLNSWSNCCFDWYKRMRQGENWGFVLMLGCWWHLPDSIIWSDSALGNARDVALSWSD